MLCWTVLCCTVLWVCPTGAEHAVEHTVWLVCHHPAAGSHDTLCDGGTAGQAHVVSGVGALEAPSRGSGSGSGSSGSGARS
jgi:hypothetical protein